MSKLKNKINSIWLLAPTTYLILVILLFFQIGWVLRLAKLEEQNFNHKVNMALRQASSNISEQQPICDDIHEFISSKYSTKSEVEEHHREKISKVDSVILAAFDEWSIDLPYNFCITDSFLHSKPAGKKTPLYYQNLDGVFSGNGIYIEVEFPTRNQFFLNQLIGVLSLSIVFLFFVFYSFMRFSIVYKQSKKTIEDSKDFINNMVHEFQTPLANMRFAAGLVKKNCEEGEVDYDKIEKHSNIIIKESKRLQRLVEEVLRIGTYKEERLKSEIVDMHEVIESQVLAHEGRTLFLDGTITFEKGASDFYVEGDFELLSLIFSNLIDNSLKYITLAPKIFIKSFNKSGKLIVTVSDNGIGIKKENLNSIYDKYYRVATGDKHNIKGFGLGLSLVYRVVKAIGGEIEVKSKLNKGTIFTIILPIKTK